MEALRWPELGHQARPPVIDSIECGRFSSVLRPRGFYGEGMDKFEEGLSQQQGEMSNEQILRRFKNLFGREMNAAERRTFFLDTLPSQDEKG